MRSKAIELVEATNISKDTMKAVTAFEAGDTLRVHAKVKEGEKERVQIFEGICIRKKHQGIAGTFTVRKVSYGVGVERIFPIFSPRIEKIEKLSSSEVNRSRLFFLRDLKGKKARLKTKDENATKGAKAPKAAKAAKA
jgi:large subunit ribosomal protein L19